LTRLELDALLAAVDRRFPLGLRDYALLLFLVDSLWPHQAALHLRWDDFTVTRQSAACASPSTLASPAPRPPLPLTPLGWPTWAAITASLQSAGRLPPADPQGYVFTPLVDPTGRLQRLYGLDWRLRPLNPCEPGRILVRLGQRLGLPRQKLTPTNLRRSAALLRWQAGLSRPELQRLLGHRRSGSTLEFLQRYALAPAPAPAERP
jgi:integrase